MFKLIYNGSIQYHHLRLMDRHQALTYTALYNISTAYASHGKNCLSPYFNLLNTQQTRKSKTQYRVSAAAAAAASCTVMTHLCLNCRNSIIISPWLSFPKSSTVKPVKNNKMMHHQTGQLLLPHLPQNFNYSITELSLHN